MLSAMSTCWYRAPRALEKKEDPPCCARAPGEAVGLAVRRQCLAVPPHVVAEHADRGQHLAQAQAGRTLSQRLELGFEQRHRLVGAAQVLRGARLEHHVVEPPLRIADHRHQRQGLVHQVARLLQPPRHEQQGGFAMRRGEPHLRVVVILRDHRVDQRRRLVDACGLAQRLGQGDAQMRPVAGP
jgi:hypothetical protein